MANQFINGRLYSWSSIEVGIGAGAGMPFDGIKAINYSDNLDPGMPRGKGPLARGYTLGNYQADGDIELYRDQFDEFVELLGGPGFMTVVFPLLVSYWEPAFGAAKTDTVVAKLKKNSTGGSSDSTDGITVKHDLAIIVPILWNGNPGVVPL